MHDNAIFIQMKVLRTEHKRFELMRVPWVLIAQMAAGLLPQIEWAFVVKYYHVGKADALRLSGMFVTSLAVEIQTSYWPLSGKASGTDFEARPRAFAADTGEGRTLTKKRRVDDAIAGQKPAEVFSVWHGRSTKKMFLEEPVTQTLTATPEQNARVQ